MSQFLVLSKATKIAGLILLNPLTLKNTLIEIVNKTKMILYLIFMFCASFVQNVTAQTKDLQNTDTEGSRLMRISLVRISLLRFFNTFQTYLANAFLGLFISLMRFLYLLG